MLADWGQAVTKLYGVHNAERNCPIRSAFLVDSQGILRYVATDLNPRDPGMYVQILEELQKLP
jgi:alkyl hydroperoxide reductase subunit AhpC